MCPPYIFVVCELANEYVIWYTRYQISTWWKWQWYSGSISKHKRWELFVMDYPNIEFNWRQRIWLVKVTWSLLFYKRYLFLMQGTKATMETHLRFAVILGAFPRKRDNEILMTVRKIKIRNRNRKRSKKKNDSTELTEAANDTPIPMFNSFEPKHRLQTQNWEKVELRHLGKQRIPYVSDVNKKLPNTEILVLTRSNFETCSRITQACRPNYEIVINSNNLTYLNYVKSDLNGVFKRCLEEKCKIFDVNDKCVKAISSNQVRRRAGFRSH